MDPKDACEEFATIERFWPGQEPDFVCVDHAVDTVKVGEAIGYSIPLRLINGDRMIEMLRDGEIPKCSCSKGHVQEINVGPVPEPNATPGVLSK